MKFYGILKIILGEYPKLGQPLEPYKIIDKINEGAKTPLIDYSDFYLYKDQETAKKWFTSLFLKYYQYESLNDYELYNSHFSGADVIYEYIIDIFTKYELLYPKYKILFDLYNDENFISKTINDYTTSTNTNETENYLNPQELEDQKDTINNKSKSKSINKIEYNNNYLNKLANIKNNYINVMDQFVNEFNNYFFIKQTKY